MWYISDQTGGKWKIQFLYLLVKYNYNEKKKKKVSWNTILKNLVIQEIWCRDRCQFENISSKVNTVQYDKISIWLVASNIDLLPVMESFSPPKEKVWVMRESFSSKIRLSISLILLMRVNLWLEKWVQWRKKCVVDSTKFPQLHKGFIPSSKLCRNLCSLRWLKPTRNLVKSFIPFTL